MRIILRIIGEDRKCNRQKVGRRNREEIYNLEDTGREETKTETEHEERQIPRDNVLRTNEQQSSERDNRNEVGTLEVGRLGKEISENEERRKW